MTSSRDTLTAFTDAAADAVARTIAEVRREAAREREAFAAEMRAVRAEWEARLASVSEVERRLADRLATLKDGEPGRDGIDGKDAVAPTADDIVALIREDAMNIASEAARSIVERWEKPKDGKDADPELIRQMVGEAVDAAVAAIPVPKDGEPGPKGDTGERGPEGPAGADGQSVTVDNVLPMIDELIAEKIAAIPAPQDGRDGIDGKDGERGPEGPPGKLPMIAAWDDRVHYEGEAVTWRGGVYQALRDTGKEPGGEDWRCIVERGQDGVDGRSFQVQSTWQDGETYRALDVVALNGASFAAKRDNPGPCPGDGWQMLAMQGKAGKPGPKGDKGDRGLAVTAAVVGGHVTDDGVIVVKNADGSEARIDAYPILSKLGG